MATAKTAWIVEAGVLLSALAAVGLTGCDPAKQELRETRRCIMFQCMAEARACTGSDECEDWMACLEDCGDDEMLCPTVCGAFYQAPEINAFTSCALDNGCIEIDFSALPACATPDVPLASVDDIDGFWWVSAIRGHDYVLYDDCQRFVLTELGEGRIEARNSTQVSHNGQTRVVDNIGEYTRMPDGTLQLAYANWVGYLEQYNPVFVSEQVMLMHVCSKDTSEIAHDYGALVLSRAPLEAIDDQDAAALEAAMQRLYGVGLDGFRMIGTESCPNGPDAPR